VRKAFQDYYRATVQVGETDPDKLHDLKRDLDGQQVYALQQVEELVALYVRGADRDKLDPILDACVEVYVTRLNETQQVEFKGKAKTFVRSYGFLGAILTYGHPAWEKLAIFLNFLIPKLPAPKEEDLSKGVLDAIDMDSYRPEVKAALSIGMLDEDGVLEPAPTGGGGGGGEPDIDKLSNIIKAFNDLFGNIGWKDADKIGRVIAEEIPQRVAQDRAYQNAVQHSDKQNARLEHDKVLKRVVLELMADHTELFKQFSDNPDFKHWLTDSVFDVTYRPGQPNSVSRLNGLKARALSVVRSKFGDALVWSTAVEALFERLGTGEREHLNLADLTAVELSHDLSVTNILFPVLNLMSADDVGVLRREFVQGDGSRPITAISFDDVRAVARASSTADGSDWADHLSIRWTLPNVPAVTGGVNHGG
jgi:type I restriction enzyme, R subunit